MVGLIIKCPNDKNAADLSVFYAIQVFGLIDHFFADPQGHGSGAVCPMQGIQLIEDQNAGASA